MLLILVVVAFGAPILWTVSVGAVREARRARQQDPRVGCQAWVAVPGLPRRLYRCAEPSYAGGPWCRRHEVLPEARDAHPDVELIDEPQSVGRALAQARIGIPLALATIVAAAAVVIVWVGT